MKTKKKQRNPPRQAAHDRLPPLSMEKIRAAAYAELVRYLAQPETGKLAMPPAPWGEQQLAGYTKEECVARLLHNGSGINGIACFYGYADHVIAAALVQICRGARIECHDDPAVA